MSRPYKNQYIFPPRPENRISPESLDKHDTNEYIVQCKLNGSCMEAYIDESEFEIKNRHNGGLSNFKLKEQEVLSLHRGKGKMMLVGEYMNKSKKDKNNIVFNHKFVIFDIIVFENQHLLGTTYQERIDILHSIYNVKEYDEYLYQIDDNIFMVKTFYKDLKILYDNIVKIDMLEGLVLKPKSSKLTPGTKKLNNLSLKCRKETKNYSF